MLNVNIISVKILVSLVYLKKERAGSDSPRKSQFALAEFHS